MNDERAPPSSPLNDASADEATRVRRAPGAASPDAETVIQPRTSGTGISQDGGDTSAHSTGSGWTHPERWDVSGAQEVRPGITIKGRFVLREEIGRGGMGVVFKALDLRKEEAQDRNPFVAVKVLNKDFKRHPESLKALERETRKSQSLAHPNVVNVFDFDRDGATVFMTMEFLDGQPLNRLLRWEYTHGLAPAEALPIIQGMAQALAYAHKNAVVHSDFKPGNIFLNKDGAVKVFDFGIAQATKHLDGQGGDDDHTLFDAGNLGALTPAYASLEMLAGEDPDLRDDIYALGCVAYELLTGRHPFNKAPADEALKKRLTPAAIHGLSRRQQRALNRALAFKRADRCPSVENFLRELVEKRRARWPYVVVAGLVTAALVGVGAFVIAPNYVSQRKTSGLAADLESGQPAVVKKALEKLDKLNDASRIVVVQQVRPELVAYFKARIAEKTDTRRGHYDFPGAMELLEQVRALYPDSAELSELPKRLAARRNRLLNQYTQQLNERLLEGRLLASDDQPGIDKLLSTIAQIDPDTPLLHDSRLPLAFARAAEDAFKASDYKRAAAVAEAGLGRFPDNVVLIKLRDKARIQLDLVDRDALVAQLRTRLQQALLSARTLKDLRPLHRDAARLMALAPDDPVIGDLRARLRPVLEAALTEAVNEHDWDVAHAELQYYASLLDPEFLQQRTQRLSAAEQQWQARVAALAADFSAALAQGQLAGPETPNATALLAQLSRIGADTKQLRWARASLAKAYLARARTARANGRLGDAAEAVKAALAQSLSGTLSEALEAERAAIAQAKKSESRPPSVDRIQGLRAELTRTLGQDHLTPHQASDALGTLRWLATLVPGDPLVATARGRLTDALVATAAGYGNQGDWRGAEETLRASLTLLPESRELLQALGHARTQRHEQSALAGLEQARR